MVTTTPQIRDEIYFQENDSWRGYVSVIIPIYNEADSVDQLLRAVVESPILKQIVIVDDGSTDGTREKLAALETTESLVVLFHEENLGKGTAIRTALRYSRGEYVLIQDSDLEYSPSDYPALLEPLMNRESNVVYGVRNDCARRSFFYLGSRLLTHLTNLLYGSHIHDEATCYKAFRRTVLSNLRLECRRFEFCPEITAKLCRIGERICEVPISYSSRQKAWEEDSLERWLDSSMDTSAIPI